MTKPQPKAGRRTIKVHVEPGYACMVCEKRYAELEDAERCEESHDTED